MSKKFLDLAFIPGERGREDFQVFWQVMAGKLFTNYSILDVGAGLNFSKDRLSNNGSNWVVTQDVAPNLPVDIRCDIGFLRDKYFNVVTSFDVIEHIIDVHSFVEQLIRIANNFIFITTPNVLISKNQSQFHAREYTGQELIDLFGNDFDFRYFIGDPHGENIKEVDRKEFTSLENKMPHLGLLVIKR
jgi:hypothetical protein